MSRTGSCALLSLLLGSCGDSGERSTEQASEAQQPAPPPSSQDTIASCGPRQQLINATCDSCLEQRCCAALTACSADTECYAVYGCFARCVAQPELPGCPASCFGNGAPPLPFEEVLSCMFDSCAEECTYVAED